MMSWDEGLSAEQRIAASYTDGHGRLLAGPGTGKTRALTSRIAYLVSELGSSPDSILALTFTRAAAGELKSRVTAMLAPGSSEIPQISTLHSYALRSILQFGAGDRLPSPIRIADDFEERWIIEEDLKQLLNLERVEEARTRINLLSADWETLDADSEDWESRFPDPGFLGAWQEHRSVYGYTLRAELVYQLKQVLAEGALEFPDVPIHVLVDEYQDLNPCDLSVVKSLSELGAQIFVAGDDDQSIYGFRYANPEGIRRFVEEYPGSSDLALSECRRCARKIIEIAQFVARQDTRRVEKLLVPRADGGEVRLLRFDDYDEEAVGVAKIAKWLVNEVGIPLDRIMVLLRSDRYQIFSTALRPAFESEGLEASAVEDPFVVLDSPDGRIFLGLLRLMENQADGLTWRTLLRFRQNNLGNQAFSRIYELARTHGTTYSDALRMISNDPNLVERQGAQIKAEYDSISTLLNRLNEDLEQSEDMSAFVASMFRGMVTPEDSEGILEVVNEAILDYEVNSATELLQALSTPFRDVEQVRAEGMINIMTMHQAKGLDADAVFVVGAEDEYIPGRAEGRAIDDERRLLYVSLTRARNYLYITHCSSRTGGQRHTGRTSGATRRSLTRFLRGGPLISRPGSEYLDDLSQ